MGQVVFFGGTRKDHELMNRFKNSFSGYGYDYFINTGDMQIYENMERNCYFIKGNHENFDELNRISLGEVSYNNLHYLKNGEILVLFNNENICAEILIPLGGIYKKKYFFAEREKLPNKEHKYLNKYDILDLFDTFIKVYPIIKNTRVLYFNIVSHESPRIEIDNEFKYKKNKHFNYNISNSPTERRQKDIKGSKVISKYFKKYFMDRFNDFFRDNNFHFYTINWISGHLKTDYSKFKITRFSNPKEKKPVRIINGINYFGVDEISSNKFLVKSMGGCILWSNPP